MKIRLLSITFMSLVAVGAFAGDHYTCPTQIENAQFYQTSNPRIAYCVTQIQTKTGAAAIRLSDLQNLVKSQADCDQLNGMHDFLEAYISGGHDAVCVYNDANGKMHAFASTQGFKSITGDETAWNGQNCETNDVSKCPFDHRF